MCYDGPDGPKTILCWKLSSEHINDPDYVDETLEEHIAKLMEQAREYYQNHPEEIPGEPTAGTKYSIGQCYDLDGNPRNSGIVY